MATRFAAAFTNTSGGNATGTATGTGNASQAWLGRLRPLITSELQQRLESVSAQRIPTGTLVDVETVSAGQSLVDVTARYDTGLVMTVRAQLQPDGTTWAVTAYLPVS